MQRRKHIKHSEAAGMVVPLTLWVVLISDLASVAVAKLNKFEGAELQLDESATPSSRGAGVCYQ